VTQPPKPAKRRPWRRFFIVSLALAATLFLLLNWIAFMQAWSITHYAPNDARTTRYMQLRTNLDKARLLVVGPTIRRMANTRTPAQYGLPYETVSFTGAHGVRLEAWRVAGQPGQPSVLMFPGYGASKDTLLHAAVEFHAIGCETWIVDFSGVGDSEGHTTTIGWREAEDVAAAVHATQNRRSGPLVLYGPSMAASAILCAQHRGLVAPDAIIIECPFDRFTSTLGNRLQLIGFPEYPLAPAIAFWVGVQNGFNGLKHNPVEYARSVRCPVLLMQGENDKVVGQRAAKSMAAALGDRATFQFLPNCGHSYIVRDGQTKWRSLVRQFLAVKVTGEKRRLGAVSIDEASRKMLCSDRPEVECLRGAGAGWDPGLKL
jgi:alpha-beta hydrolase superfamily lysophospholipase